MHFQGLLGGARDDARSHKALLLPPIKTKKSARLTLLAALTPVISEFLCIF